MSGKAPAGWRSFIFLCSSFKQPKGKALQRAAPPVARPLFLWGRVVQVAVMSRAVFVSAAPSSPWHGCVLCLFFFFKSQIKIIFPKSCSCLCPGDGGEPAAWWAFRMGGEGSWSTVGRGLPPSGSPAGCGRVTAPPWRGERGCHVHPLGRKGACRTSASVPRRAELPR